MSFHTSFVHIYFESLQDQNYICKGMIFVLYENESLLEVFLFLFLLYFYIYNHTQNMFIYL